MKYICLGYIEPGKVEGMSEDERHAVLDECFDHGRLHNFRFARENEAAGAADAAA